jgi:hypothetical protein
LDEFAAMETVCDIASWLQYCMSLMISLGILTDTYLIDAFDVIGELTFSKPLGFLEQGGDVDGIIAALEKMLDYSGKVSYFCCLVCYFI